MITLSYFTDAKRSVGALGTPNGGIVDDVKIRVIADDEAGELIALLRWLRTDRRLQGRVRLNGRPPGPAELGGTLETVGAVLDTAAASVALAESLAAWIHGRRRAAVKISITTRDGRTLQLEAADSADALLLLGGLLRHTADDA